MLNWMNLVRILWYFQKVHFLFCVFSHKFPDLSLLCIPYSVLLWSYMSYFKVWKVISDVKILVWILLHDGLNVRLQNSYVENIMQGDGLGGGTFGVIRSWGQYPYEWDGVLIEKRPQRAGSPLPPGEDTGSPGLAEGRHSAMPAPWPHMSRSRTVRTKPLLFRSHLVARTDFRHPMFHAGGGTIPKLYVQHFKDI